MRRVFVFSQRKITDCSCHRPTACTSTEHTHAAHQVGPLLEKLGELAARSSKRGGGSGSRKGDHHLLSGPGGGDEDHHQQQRRASLATTISTSFMNLNVAGDSTDIDSEESSRRGRAGSSGPLQLSSQPLASSGPARLATMGYGDVRGPLWVRQAVADMMGECMFGREDVDPNNVVIAAGATSVLR